MIEYFDIYGDTWVGRTQYRAFTKMIQDFSNKHQVFFAASHVRFKKPLKASVVSAMIVDLEDWEPIQTFKG